MPTSSPLHRTRRPATALAAGLAVAAAAAGTASAATITLPQAAPVAEIPFTYAVDVQSDVTAYLHVRYRPAGGAPCAPDVEADGGTRLIDNRRFSGAQSLTQLRTFGTPGTYLVCAWMRSGARDVLAIAQTTMTVRAPTGSLRIDAPAQATPGRPFVVNLIGQTESPRRLYATWRPSGGPPCAPTEDSDGGSTFVWGDRAEGVFASVTQLTLPSRGRYVICAWLARSDSDL
jgi:hypothetical protein